MLNNMVKTSQKFAASSVMLLTLAACASAPALEYPTGERSARIPLNTPMPAPQWASAAPMAAAAMPVTVAANSVPAPAPSAPGQPAQGTAAPQQFQPQPAAAPAPGPDQKPVPAGAKTAPPPTPAAGQDEAKKLLAQDAAKVIEKPPVKADIKPTDKQLGGTINSAKITSSGKLYHLDADQDKKPAEAKQDEAKADGGKKEAVQTVKTEAVKEAAPKPDAKPVVKSDVVEVKPVVKAEPLPSWSANAGTTLRQTIEGWSHKEGWDVRWESELLDYPIEETFSMVGKYLDVITRVFELYKDAKRPFKVEVYPSQKLVVVKEKK